MGQSILQWSADPTDESGKPQPLIRGADIPLQAGGGRASFSLEDLSLIAAPTLGVCIVQRMDTAVPAHFRRVLFRAPMQKNEWVATPVIQLATNRNLEISGCTIEGFSCIAVEYGSASYLRITDNLLRWRGAPLKLVRDHHNIIFQRNHLVMIGTFEGNGYTKQQNANPGVWYDGFDASNIRDLYFANNTSTREEAEPPDNCVGITFDGYNAAYWGKIAAVNGLRLTLASPMNGGDNWGHQPCQPGAFVRIVAGRGVGQWRHLTTLKTTRVTEIEVDRPWDVNPDGTSWLAVNNFEGRTLFVQNEFGNEPCLQTYFGTADVIWAENKIGVQGRHVAMPIWVGPIRGGMQSGWHYQVLDNQVFDTEMITAIPNWGPTPDGYTGPMTGGHIYRGNRGVGSNGSFVIRPPARTEGLLIEDNVGLSELHLEGAKETRGILRANTNTFGDLMKPACPAGLGVLVNP